MHIRALSESKSTPEPNVLHQTTKQQPTRTANCPQQKITALFRAVVTEAFAVEIAALHEAEKHAAFPQGHQLQTEWGSYKRMRVVKIT
jgi:hypothetical protein